jgi:hypothetical protein
MAPFRVSAFALPRSVLASRVLPVAGILAGGRRVFAHLYARHANTRKPVSVAVSAVACKRVGSGLQMCTFWLTTGVIPGLHRAFNSCRQMPYSWRQCRRFRNLNTALAAVFWSGGGVGQSSEAHAPDIGVVAFLLRGQFRKPKF